jgi:predicted DNA binding CopG/RHH family protein
MGNRAGAKLERVNARLFAADVLTIKKIAAQRGLPWHIELRMLVRRALKGETREILMLKDTP